MIQYISLNHRFDVQIYQFTQVFKVII